MRYKGGEEMEELTTNQVAEKLQVVPETVRKYIRNKQLKAYKVGKKWIVRKEDLEQFKFKNSSMDK